MMMLQKRIISGCSVDKKFFYVLPISSSDIAGLVANPGYLPLDNSATNWS